MVVIRRRFRCSALRTLKVNDLLTHDVPASFAGYSPPVREWPKLSVTSGAISFSIPSEDAPSLRAKLPPARIAGTSRRGTRALRGRRWPGLERRRGGARESVAPEPFEAVLAQFGVADGVLNRTVAEPVLNGARIVALIGQGVTAGVPKHVRVDLEGEFGARTDALDQAIDGICREWAAARASARDRCGVNIAPVDPAFTATQLSGDPAE
jgi:hypothetical protein